MQMRQFLRKIATWCVRTAGGLAKKDLLLGHIINKAGKRSGIAEAPWHSTKMLSPYFSNPLASRSVDQCSI
jgi:hypothetical protein